MKKVLSYLFIISIVTTLSSCNDTDNLTAIFLKNPKKMTMIFDSKQNDYNAIWNSEQEKAESIKLKGTVGDENQHYTLRFDGVESNGKISGNLTGKAVKTTLRGSWTADGKSNSMSIRLDSSINPGSESDKLAKTFIETLPQVYKYEGDSKSLTLYSKQGQTKIRIGFVNDQQ